MVSPAGESEEGGDRKEAGKGCPMAAGPRRFWLEAPPVLGARDWLLCGTVDCCWSREGLELRAEMLLEFERP